MLKTWYGSLQDWKFWDPEMEASIPPVTHIKKFLT
jgi:hypothetical protein